MIEVLGLEHLGLVADGPTLTLSIGKGQAVSVAGPAAAGKTRLLGVLAGAERPAHGTVRRYGTVAGTADVPLSRRQRVQSLTKKGGAYGGSASKAADLLVATQLHDARQSLVSDLTPGQVAACELIGPLSSGADLIFIDGQLDRLDPWALRSTLRYIDQLRAAGVAFVVTTSRPDLITAFDALIVLKSNHVRFAGTVDDLLRVGPPHALSVETENRPGVRALVSPFEVSVQDVPGGVRLEASEGQALAARLLLEGYGDVKFVVIRPPTVEDALLSLF
jgi:ABC-2 type transport system ATP-binding protein